MKSKLLLVVSAVIGLAATQLKALPIDGEISFGGAYTVNNSNLSLTAGFNSFTGVTVADVFGDYSVFSVGTAVVWSPFTFDPFTPVASLWSISAGSNARFDLESLTVEYESSTSILLSGKGTAYLDGKDPTPGLWNMTANTMRRTFSFSSTSAASSVPDGGASLVLLCAGLLGVGLMRRMRMR